MGKILKEENKKSIKVFSPFPYSQKCFSFSIADS